VVHSAERCRGLTMPAPERVAIGGGKLVDHQGGDEAGRGGDQEQGISEGEHRSGRFHPHK
jgi:hypothetical protein